jgi:hypothetical protein
VNRRRFLTACIATIAAPAIVRAESLMRVRSGTWVGVDWGASCGDVSGLVMLQQAQNAIDLAMADQMYVVMHPSLYRELMDIRPNKVWRVPDGPKILINRWLPR